MELTRTQFYLYLFLGQVIIGIVLGLIPFFLARKKGKASLGNWGLLITTIAGALSPLAAIIVVAVYVWLIVKNPSESADTNNE